jgi:hypothetical protein
MNNKLQKNRYNRTPKKIIIPFGEAAIIVLNEGRIEFVQLNLLKKKIKKLTSRRNSKHAKF